MLVSEATDLFREFDNQVALGTLDPSLFSRNADSFLPPNDEVLFEEGCSKINGIVHYSRAMVDDPLELEILLFEEFGDRLYNRKGRLLDRAFPRKYRGLRHHDYSRPIVQIGAIESFEKGCGRRLVERVAEKTDASTIFLVPASTAIGFYNKLDFEHSGLYYRISPILVKNF